MSDTQKTTAKPWPQDALMLVAFDKDDPQAETMKRAFECECRDCGRALRVETFKVSIGMRLSRRHNKPLKFFCIECAVTYNCRVTG